MLFILKRSYPACRSNWSFNLVALYGLSWDAMRLLPLLFLPQFPLIAVLSDSIFSFIIILGYLTMLVILPSPCHVSLAFRDIINLCLTLCCCVTNKPQTKMTITSHIFLISWFLRVRKPGTAFKRVFCSRVLS